MRYFFDTEFMEDGSTIDLLSIGIVAQDGRELYLENEDADASKANDFVREHVLPLLGQDSNAFPLRGSLYRQPGQKQPTRPSGALCSSREAIRDAILEFIGDDQEPEFWAYYADYDWVVFCQLWGRMVDLPKHFPRWCRDLRQFVEHQGSSIAQLHHEENTWMVDDVFRLPGFKEHHALWDARWCKLAYYAVDIA